MSARLRLWPSGLISLLSLSSWQLRVEEHTEQNKWKKKDVGRVDSVHANEDAQYLKFDLKASRCVPPEMVENPERVDADDKESLFDQLLGDLMA
jgi:hypothetical protein